MTSLLAGPRTKEAQADVTHRRPLVLLAILGGAAAAAGPLVICLAVGVVGWFLTDAGAHGAPRDGLRAGAIGWLVGHGSGLMVGGVSLTAIPLGITLACVWSVWRIAHRVGDSVSGHGPDADAIADGARDWTVPIATVLFTAAYVAVALTVLRLAGGAPAAPSASRVVMWCLVLGLVVGGVAIAIGAGQGGDLDGVPALVAARLVDGLPQDRHHLPPGVGSDLRGGAGHRPRHRPQRDVRAAHRHRRRHALLGADADAGPERGPLRRCLSPRPRLRDRHGHGGQPDGGGARPRADVPAARGAARRRHPGALAGAAPAGAAARRGRRGGSCAPPLPDLPLGGGRGPRLRRRDPGRSGGRCARRAGRRLGRPRSHAAGRPLRR